MRLLNTETLKLQDFFDEGIPSYAILSHRWESDEVSYQDLEAGKNKDGAGYRKILRCCAKALDDGHDWVWIDTCCIDKKSSAELSEAINTMFNWYQSATLCYAYLSDVEPIVTEGPLSYPTFKDSLWFTRGWTLQELISPTEVLFLDRNWSEIGTRTSLANEITAATGIPGNAYKTLDSFSVAQKMSWASKRKTSRVEDIAYSLLGLFDVNMPMLYGEGKRAFIRLQEEIIKRSDDESIFVWSVDDLQEQSLVAKLQELQANRQLDDRSIYAWHSEDIGSGNLFAPRPSCFASCTSVQRDVIRWRRPYALTNKGLEITVALFEDPRSDRKRYLIPLNCTKNGEIPLAMSLARPLGCWVRCGFDEMNHGSPESLFNAIHDQDNAHQLYISAQFPTYPIHNLAQLRPIVNEDGSRVFFQNPLPDDI